MVRIATNACSLLRGRYPQDFDCSDHVGAVDFTQAHFKVKVSMKQSPVFLHCPRLGARLAILDEFLTRRLEADVGSGINIMDAILRPVRLNSLCAKKSVAYENL